MIRNTRILGFICAALLLAACSEQLTDQAYVEKALDYLDKGQPKAAAIELRNALRQNQENAQARRLLGTTHLLLGDPASAEKELRVARDLGVSEASVLPALAKALLAQVNLDALSDLQASTLQPGQEQAEVLASQASGKLLEGKTSESETLIERAKALAPESRYVRLVSAGVASDTGNADLALSLLQELVSEAPEFGEAWSLLGDLYRKSGQFDDAENAYIKAVNNRFANNADMIHLALVRIQLQKYAEAQKDVDILSKRVPKHAAVNYAQGLLYLQENNLNAAKNAFEASLDANPRQLPPKYLVSMINLRQGNLEQADDYGEQTLAAAPASVAVRKLLATIKLRMGLYEEAGELVRPIVEQFADDEAATDILATSLVARGQYESAIPLLSRLVEMQPESAMAEMRLGAALMNRTGDRKGISHLQSVISKDPTLGSAWNLLTQYYVSNGEIETASDVAQNYQKANPKSAAPWNLIADIAKRAGDRKRSNEAYREALRLEPGNPVASHALAEIATAEKRYDSARQYYQGVLATNGSDLKTLISLALLDLVEEKPQGMISGLEKAISLHPKAPEPRVVLARYYILDGQPERVAALMLDLDNREKNLPEVKEVLAYADVALHQYREAKQKVEDLLKSRADAPQLHFLLARVAAGLGDVATLKRELNTTVELSPEHVPAHVALARLAAAQRNPAAARFHMSELLRIAPDYPGVQQLKASVARLEGRNQETVAMLEEIFEESPSTSTMMALAQQEWVMGNEEEAISLQERWTKENPDDVLAALKLAGSYARKGQEGKALTQYERVLQSDENNVVALNELAWSLRQKAPAKALQYAEQASELAPESGKVLDTLAMVQLNNNQLEMARRSVERALRNAPDNPSIRYHSALIAETTGDVRGATEILVSLLKDSARFPEREEAEKMLRRLRVE